MCKFCDIVNDIAFTNTFTPNEENDFVEGIYAGLYSLNNLPYSVYASTVKKLLEAVNSGYGKGILEVSWGSPDYLMLQDLNESIYFFSGAKTFQQTMQMTDALKTTKSFGEFKKQANQIFETFNKNYLQAEYQTAIASSRMAGYWLDIKATEEILPLLQYQTIGDDRVRAEHKMLDNIIRPVNDKFWNNYYPPNGFRCRCTVIQLETGELTDVSKFKQPETVPNEFMTNSGKTRMVFSKKHPYFKVPKKYKEFAKTNFGLPYPANG